MITKKVFLMEFNGHANAYSSYMVIDVKLDDLLKALNEINPDMCVGSGKVSERSIYFEICKELPDLISVITAKLHCKGFSDIGGWYGSGNGYFVATKDGVEYDDYTAEWEEDFPMRREYEFDPDTPDEEIDWDAFILITDNESGQTFYTGEGAIDYEDMLRWKELVDTH